MANTKPGCLRLRTLHPWPLEATVRGSWERVTWFPFSMSYWDLLPQRPGVCRASQPHFLFPQATGAAAHLSALVRTCGSAPPGAQAGRPCPLTVSSPRPSLQPAFSRDQECTAPPLASPGFGCTSQPLSWEVGVTGGGLGLQCSAEAPQGPLMLLLVARTLSL